MNLVERVRPSPEAERVDVLAAGGAFRLERIVSLGHVTPAGEWYDQDECEWVLLVSGRARLQFEGDADELDLRPGDSLLIESHRRHRVSWTDPSTPTVWLALHFDPT